MTKLIFIFSDRKGNKFASTNHDYSLMPHLPRKGEKVLDMTERFGNNEPVEVKGTVSDITHNYNECTVVVQITDCDILSISV